MSILTVVVERKFAQFEPAHLSRAICRGRNNTAKKGNFMRNKSIEESWSSYVIDYIAKTGACAYFLTLETKNWYTNGGGSFLSRRSVDRVHANFNSVYRHICSLLMKNHMRKLRFHPFAIAAVDMPGTRTGSVNLYVAPPHLHALLLIKPQHQARFQALVDTKFEALRQHNSMSWIHELDVEPVRKIYRVTSYACKFDRFAEAMRARRG